MKSLVVSLSLLLAVVTPLAHIGQAVAAAGPNLLANPSAETADSTGNPSNWQKGGWGTNTAILSYKDGGHTGSKSLYVGVSNYTDGDAKWYATPVAVTANASYTYSDYYMSSVNTALIAQFEDTQGGFSYKELASAAASSTWKQVSAAFTTPANIKNVTVFHLIAQNGWLQTDDGFLGLSDIAPAPDPTPTPTPGGEIIPNGSVETASTSNANLPANWQKGGWGTNNRTYNYLNTGHTGTRSAQVSMTSRTDGDAEWIFDAQPIAPGKVYTFSDYYKSNVATEVDARVTMADGSMQFVYLGSAVASPGWLHFERTFTAPANAASVTIMHILYQAGTLTTDDYSLKPYQITGFNRAIVSLTFDDAWRDVYTNALPVMKKYNIVSTQYLLTGNTADPDYMTSAMMKAFATAGHEIASHTVTHPDLTTVSSTQLTTELSQSQRSLRNWTGQTVNNFATPYGSYNSTVLNAIKKYYGSHRGVEAGYNGKSNFDIYDLKVQNIVNTTTAADIAKWVAQAQADKTWLILVYHQVSTDPAAGEYSITPAELESEIQTIKSSGISVQTVAQALNEVKPQLGQ